MADNADPQGKPPVAPGADTGSTGPVLGDVVPRERLNQEIRKRRELEEQLATATAAAQPARNSGDYWDDVQPPVAEAIKPLETQIQAQGERLDKIVPGLEAMVVEAQVRANQVKAKAELKIFFSQKESEGYELTDAYRETMVETYVNEIAVGQLFGFVPLEEVESLVLGRLTKVQMKADAKKREAGNAEEAAPEQNPATAAAAGSTVVSESDATGKSGVEDPFKGLNPHENANWQADFMSRFGGSDFESGNTKGKPVQDEY